MRRAVADVALSRCMSVSRQQDWRTGYVTTGEMGFIYYTVCCSFLLLGFGRVESEGDNWRAKK